MPLRSRLFFGTIPGALERRRCPKCSVVWLVAVLDKRRATCISCGGKTELLERIDSDGVSELQRAKKLTKQMQAEWKEAWKAAHPKPKRRRRRVA